MNDRYEKLTEKFIQDMEAVGGDFGDFVEALHSAAIEIQDRWQQAKEEEALGG